MYVCGGVCVYMYVCMYVYVCVSGLGSSTVLVLGTCT